VLRQLARLRRSVATAGPRACALAVYADEGDAPTPARERGEEGVACVDDAARALVLFCDLWHATGSPRAREWAEGLLDFVLWMQLPDGRFVNFIRDWSGERNEDGPTSEPGGAFWQARGLRGLVKAWLVLDDERAGAGFERGLALVRSPGMASDIRAVLIAASLDALHAGHDGGLRGDLVRWCEEIAALRQGDVLLDYPGTLHLWGHSQEAALCDAGALLGREDLIETARRSAEAVFVDAIESAFALPVVQPYGVASAVYAMDRLGLVTGDHRYLRLAADARAWFDGRNSAGAPVYDRLNGRVADGIDDGRLNPRSGAESNVVAAQALFAEVAQAAARRWPEP
jgi:hypothetical protein